MTRWQQGLGLIAWVGLCYAVAWVGSQFLPGPWFEQLAKPSWNPPNWVFAPVWTVLYTLMGIAAWLVWKEEGLRGARGALTLFVVQLLVNGSWSWVFFGRHAIGAAAVVIVMLWFLIAATLVGFWRRRAVAGLLLAPYLAWVSFATVLNLVIWSMNR